MSAIGCSLSGAPAERLVAEFDPQPLPHLRQPAFKRLIDLLSGQGLADSWRQRFQAIVARIRLLQLRKMLLVVGRDILVRHQDTGPKALIDEAEHCQLPQEVTLQLFLREVVPGQLRAEPCVRACEAIALQLLKEVIGILLRWLRVLTAENILPHEFLIDQALRSPPPAGRALVKRLAVQEAGDA